ncbi:hypothetical protein [Halorubrum trapanicum]|nr:hypothetical protein [Halorubrum trapanicum]
MTSERIEISEETYDRLHRRKLGEEPVDAVLKRLLDQTEPDRGDESDDE